MAEVVVDVLMQKSAGEMLILMYFNLEKEMLGKSEKEIYHVGISTYESEDGYYGTLLVYLPK